jgi:hypothetical protein
MSLNPSPPLSAMLSMKSLICGVCVFARTRTCLCVFVCGLMGMCYGGGLVRFGSRAIEMIRFDPFQSDSIRSDERRISYRGEEHGSEVGFQDTFWSRRIPGCGGEYNILRRGGCLIAEGRIPDRGGEEPYRGGEYILWQSQGYVITEGSIPYCEGQPWRVPSRSGPTHYT